MTASSSGSSGGIACPFCRAPQPQNALSMAPCASCGRHPMDHPSMRGGLDDALADDASVPDLELDRPKPPPAAPVRARPAPPDAPPEIDLASVPPKPLGTVAAPSEPPPPAPAASAAASLPAPPPPAPKEPSALTKAALLVAKYPPPPSRRVDEPLYACRVLKRQMELRLDLDVLRRKRSPDVALYEEALRVHDAAAFRRGGAVVAAALAVLLVLFFMPVILRFARAPE